jgi:hypothetical protein
MFERKIDKYYIDDCKEIQRYLKPYFGEVPLIVCESLWCKFSESWCAGWLCLSPIILDNFKQWLDEEDSEEQEQ